MRIYEKTKTFYTTIRETRYLCERCGGHGGTNMDDGYLPCFNCGDTGYQEYKPEYMVTGPFCRGVVTTSNYRQGWYY